LINSPSHVPYGVRVNGQDPDGTQPGAERGNGPIGQIELQLAVLVRHTAGTSRASSAEPRLERSAYLLLSVLAQQQPTSVNALADRLGLNASTITRQVDAMEAALLVRRVKHPDDGRVTLVEVTDRGVARFASERAARRRFYDAVTAHWSADDRLTLARLLTRLNGDLDAVGRSRQPAAGRAEPDRPS
jgi:DNA-binding MarR family transcriptional regulator